MQERKLYTLEEKRQHVASGLTRQQYCELHGIKFSTFREWPQDTKAERRVNDSGLIPVRIATAQPVVPAPSVVNDPIMLFLPGGIRMSCRATQLTDVFRAVKPIDTMTQYVQDELKSSWHEGAAFVFTNKSSSRIKVLRLDKHGVWLCVRRLHKGHFRWPRADDKAWSLTQDEFNWLITGVDWQQLNGDDLAKWVFREESGSAVTSL